MAMRGRTHTPCAANVFGLHGNTYPCEAQCHWRHGCQQLLQSRRAPPTSATIIVATILWHCVCVCVLVRQQHVVLHPPPADTRAVQLCCSQKSTCRQPLLLLCFTSLLPCTATTMTTTFLFWSCCIQPLTHAVAFVAQGTRTHIKARWFDCVLLSSARSTNTTITPHLLSLRWQEASEVQAKLARPSAGACTTSCTTTTHASPSIP